MLNKIVQLYQSLDGQKLRDGKLLDRVIYDVEELTVGSRKIPLRLYVEHNYNKGSGECSPISIPGTRFAAPFFPSLIVSNVTSGLIEALRSEQFLSVVRKYGLLAINLQEGGFSNFKLLAITDLMNSKSEHDAGQVVDLTDGLWFNDQGDHFVFRDAKYATEGDAPLQSMAQKLKYILPHYPEILRWILQNEPPADGAKLREWYRQMIGICIHYGWNLLWRGVLHTEHHSLRSIGSALRRCDRLRELNWPADARINVMRLGSGVVSERMSLNALLNPSGGAQDPVILKMKEAVYDNADEINRMWKRAGGQNESLLSRITNHLQESEGSQPLEESLLMEWLTYDQLLASTIDHWPVRLKTVRDVKTKPPELVMLKSGDIDLAFDFVTPSTSGKPHKGNITFMPKSGQSVADKLKGWWDKIKKKLSKWRGKEVPKAVLTGADLRKMKCKVSCDCEDYLYRMEVANHRRGASDIVHSNGQAPNKTNPNQHPGLCKHLLGCLRYLSNSAEMTVGEDGHIDIEYNPVMDSSLKESFQLHSEKKFTEKWMWHQEAEVELRKWILTDGSKSDFGTGPVLYLRLHSSKLRNDTGTSLSNLSISSGLHKEDGGFAVRLDYVTIKCDRPLNFKEIVNTNFAQDDLSLNVRLKMLRELYSNGSLKNVEHCWDSNLDWLNPRNLYDHSNFDESVRFSSLRRAVPSDGEVSWSAQVTRTVSVSFAHFPSRLNDDSEAIVLNLSCGKDAVAELGLNREPEGVYRAWSDHGHGSKALDYSSICTWSGFCSVIRPFAEDTPDILLLTDKVPDEALERLSEEWESLVQSAFAEDRKKMTSQNFDESVVIKWVATELLMEGGSEEGLELDKGITYPLKVKLSSIENNPGASLHKAVIRRVDLSFEVPDGCRARSLNFYLGRYRLENGELEWVDLDPDGVLGVSYDRVFYTVTEFKDFDNLVPRMRDDDLSTLCRGLQNSPQYPQFESWWRRMVDTYCPEGRKSLSSFENFDESVEGM